MTWADLKVGEYYTQYVSRSYGSFNRYYLVFKFEERDHNHFINLSGKYCYGSHSNYTDNDFVEATPEERKELEDILEPGRTTKTYQIY